jgi:hypothetical protein
VACVSELYANLDRFIWFLGDSSMVENNNFGHPAIPKFDGHYDHWAMLMENLLRSKEYWVIVEQGVPVQPATPTAEQRKLVEEGKLKDLKAKNYLFQSIDRSIIETIFDKSLSRAIWESMLKSFKDLQR